MKRYVRLNKLNVIALLGFVRMEDFELKAHAQLHHVASIHLLPNKVTDVQQLLATLAYTFYRIIADDKPAQFCLGGNHLTDSQGMT